MHTRWCLPFMWKTALQKLKLFFSSPHCLSSLMKAVVDTSGVKLCSPWNGFRSSSDFSSRKGRVSEHGSGLAFSVIFYRLGDPQKSALLRNVAFWVQKLVSFTAAAQCHADICNTRQTPRQQVSAKRGQVGEKLFFSISFCFLLVSFGAVGARMGQLCGRCMQLLRDFVVFIQKMSSELVRSMKECLALISECSCLKQNGSKTRQLYKPILQPHERVTVQEFLQQIERGFEMSPLGKDLLEALRILAFSENPGLQQSAALYYLHMSQHMNVPLPAEHLESFYALLRSADLEVQQISSLSLVNFLLEGNIDKEIVVQMGLLEPILDLLESEDPTVQCNSCACTMTLAVSESNREAISAARGVTPLLSLANSYDPRVQQNAVGAILNLTQSERIQLVLCKEGALPVLTLLLESPDSEVQYYSCAALSNIAANAQHHEAMLRIGDRFLLSTLISLLSSTVDKVSSQACICLRNLATRADTQAKLVAKDVLPRLCSLLVSSTEDVCRAAVALLWVLSQYPHNQVWQLIL
uniref:Vacuolar protein 8 n=1 Tax=Pavo cristatus TaxID=9049 RepID=A0A8C9LED0_PAVCR